MKARVTFANGVEKEYEYGRMDRTNVSYILTDTNGDPKYEIPFASVMEIEYIKPSTGMSLGTIIDQSKARHCHLTAPGFFIAKNGATQSTLFPY